MDVALSEYQAAVDALFARTAGGIKPGLERTEAILEAVGSPHRRLRVFHVAGTNGKGSTCATLDAILRAKRFRVGRYTSPHLVDFRERILVDGRPIGEEKVTRWLRDHDPLIESLGATFFEATTALAFRHFVDEEVDVAVVEVGLGGRLDSTNVFERPLATIVTRIGYDHMEILGDTIEKIALEKAGIFKRGAPAVISDPSPESGPILERAAAERGAAPVLSVGAQWKLREQAATGARTTFRLAWEGLEEELWTPLVGQHQAYNAAGAIVALRVADGGRWAPTTGEAQRGLANVRLAGRFQRVGDTIFDVCHNGEGAAVIEYTLREIDPPRPLVVLLAVLADKDWRGIIESLGRVADRFVLTSAPTAPLGRQWNPDEALAFARQLGFEAVVVRDFDRALEESARGAGTRLVTGSFHTVGDAMARLQVDPLAG